jgi:hypothetical protein
MGVCVCVCVDRGCSLKTRLRKGISHKANEFWTGASLPPLSSSAVLKAEVEAAIVRHRQQDSPSAMRDHGMSERAVFPER